MHAKSDLLRPKLQSRTVGIEGNTENQIRKGDSTCGRVLVPPPGHNVHTCLYLLAAGGGRGGLLAGDRALDSLVQYKLVSLQIC